MDDAAVRAEMKAAECEARRYGEVMTVAGLKDALRHFSDEMPVVVFAEESSHMFGVGVRLVRSTRGHEYVLIESDGNTAIAREEF